MKDDFMLLLYCAHGITLVFSWQEPIHQDWDTST